MALRFSNTADIEYRVYSTSDESVSCSSEAAQLYLSEGDESGLEISEEATAFIIKPLSLQDREKAEIKAGSHTRSELGRLLNEQKPADPTEFAIWQHELSDDEKRALSTYQMYINQCYYELVRAGLVKIEGIDEDPFEALMKVQPESVRIGTLMELVCHIQRVSILKEDEKKN